MAAATGAAAVDDDDVWVYHEKQGRSVCFGIVASLEAYRSSLTPTTAQAAASFPLTDRSTDPHPHHTHHTPPRQQTDSQLCGQHALNALLQGPFFTAPDLAGAFWSCGAACRV